MCVGIRTGCRVSNATFNAIVMRYSDKDGHIKFNDFVAAYVKLRTLFGKIHRQPSVFSGLGVALMFRNF